MSLRSLNKQIEQRRQALEKQRRCALSLMEQQKAQALTQANRIPLPLAMLGAFAAGFIIQRVYNKPSTRSLVNWYLTLRNF
ncbi:hypothetical protein [Microbulbifer agarilyticus]|uniref:hypothetical protein n=1 Tax=Microbulbifer agarilyticus TaxID=260552 RepID=UPI001C95C5D3|nr:hypothetical protein [Microbulbifer agarilyticus]MBY6191615.1 hypothetical protein [Microbulbifer agarilyticus]MBY6212476.1 hypothetical protein [Microbulbifer agarilyticus]MCA0894093.1 hypothetical protein [Microbulbifer agarilyticus]MCA0901613.1 hypothetical protein [Microbulbifer agarilyticus]